MKPDFFYLQKEGVHITPQARGWTFQAPSDRSGCRLPRRRGDGPSRHRRTGAVADSPAGAGMDLPGTVGPERLPTPPQARGWTFQTPSDRSGCRLPRRRGDGPSRHRRTGAVADSPAGAGMDLPDTAPERLPTPPQARGWTIGPERLPTPPQARGWTFQAPSDRSGCRLPRRRGDGPSRHHRTGAVADSPAGAGMDLPGTIGPERLPTPPQARAAGASSPVPRRKAAPPLHFVGEAGALTLVRPTTGGTRSGSGTLSRKARRGHHFGQRRGG